MLKVVHDPEGSNENTAGGSLLNEIVRDGGRRCWPRLCRLRSPLRRGVRRPARRARPAAGGPQRPPPGPRGHHGRGRGAGAGVAGQRQARRRVRGTAAVLLVDPARLVAQVPAGGRGASAAAPAWPVQLGLRTGARAVPRHRRWPVAGDDHPAHHGLASWSNDPTNQQAINKSRDQGGHETGRHVGQRELPVRFGCLTGWGCMDGLRHAGWAGR